MIVARQVPQSVFNTQSQSLIDYLGKNEALLHLYEHQIEAVKQVRNQLQDRQQPNIALVVLPTGCGKTGVAVLAAFVLNASRVLVITPSVKISEQIYEAFCGSEKRDCFLVERGIVRKEDENYFRATGICITKAKEIRGHTQHPFMVVNAHKIGGASSVEIDSIQDTNYDLVIVDEAHHYPAPTWHLLVDHFPNSRRLFLTATPYHGGKPILKHNPCFDLSRQDAVQKGIVRPVAFEEVQHAISMPHPMRAIAAKVIEYLDQHDAEDTTTKHQAMVLTQTIRKETLHPAELFQQEYNAVAGDRDKFCEIYVCGTEKQILENFVNGNIRTLVVVGRLLEGFDNKRISVVAIARNVATKSKVLFAQFVGRAVRKAHRHDPVTAVIVSELIYKQKVNFDQFDKVTEEENDDEMD